MPPTFSYYALKNVDAISSRLDCVGRTYHSRQEIDGEEDSTDSDSDDDDDPLESDDGIGDVRAQILTSGTQSSPSSQRSSGTIQPVTVTSVSVSAELYTVIIYRTLTPTSTYSPPMMTPVTTSHAHTSRGAKPTSADSSVLNNLPSETSNALPGILIGSVFLLLISCIALIKMRGSAKFRRKWREIGYYFNCCPVRGRKSRPSPRMAVVKPPGELPFWDVGGLIAKRNGDVEKPLPKVDDAPRLVPKLRVAEHLKATEEEDGQRPLPLLPASVTNSDKDSAIPSYTRERSGTTTSSRSRSSSLTISIPPPRPLRYLIVANPSPGLSAQRLSISLASPSLSFPSTSAKIQPSTERFATVKSSHSLGLANDLDQLRVSEGDYVRVLPPVIEDGGILCIDESGKQGFVPEGKLAFERREENK